MISCQTPIWTQAADALIGAGMVLRADAACAISGRRACGRRNRDRLLKSLVPRIESLISGPYTSGKDVDYGRGHRGCQANIERLVQTGG